MLSAPAPAPGHPGERGYALAALIVAIAVMGILASVALPVLSQSAQREKEAELIFRGEQYARAVGLFQRKMGPGTLPPNFDLLVDQKFLRKKYKDPITGKEFRPLTMGEAAATGAGRAVPGAGQGGQGAQGQLRGGRGAAVGAFQGGTASSGLGGIPTGMTGVPGGQGGIGGGRLPQGGGMPQGGGLPQGGSLPGGGIGSAGGVGGAGGIGGAGGRTGGPGSDQGPQGGLVGVVSRSTAASVRLYNGQDHYDKWAFVYNAPTDVAGGVPGQVPGGQAGAIGPDGRPVPGAPGAGQPGGGVRATPTAPGTPGSPSTSGR